jgi:transcriptional regulator with XRE-family HTH domain
MLKSFLIIDIQSNMTIMRTIMPAKTVPTTDQIIARLAALGQQIRAHRKALKVSATTAAEAAGMSRVTLHRIEAGEPSVTIGAYLNAMAAIGLELTAAPPAAQIATVAPHETIGWIPTRIRLADYPELKRLAWQVQGTADLTPIEALSIYERNGRHLDARTMEPREQDLLAALRDALAGGVPNSSNPGV